MKLSIIVPVYNVEQYLFKCLNSITTQGLIDYEVIIVNDGSTDNSVLTAKNFCDKYDNFYLLTKENGGLSSARNFGLYRARGEYIYFLDSDDFLEECSLIRVMEEIEEYRLDGIAFNFRKILETGESIPQKNYYRDIGIVTGNGFLHNFTCVSNVWSYVYRKDILIKNGLSFFEGIYHEDELFTPQAISYCNRFKYLDIVVYNYLQRRNSIMTTVGIEHEVKKFNSKIIVLSELLKFSQKKKKEEGLDYHPVDKKIEDLVVSLVIQFCKNDEINKIYKKDKLNKVLPNDFKVKIGGFKKRLIWLVYTMIR